MIFHISIDADDPRRVAAAIARLWGAEVFAFPPVAEGSVIVLAGDERNSAIEIYPRGTELHPATGDADPHVRQGPGRRHSATHIAVATALSTDEVLALAAAEGWIAKYQRRGDLFGVIELWVENCLMIEVLTAEMQAEYLAAMTPQRWADTLAAGPPKAA